MESIAIRPKKSVVSGILFGRKCCRNKRISRIKMGVVGRWPRRRRPISAGRTRALGGCVAAAYHHHWQGRRIVETRYAAYRYVKKCLRPRLKSNVGPDRGDFMGAQAARLHFLSFSLAILCVSRSFKRLRGVYSRLPAAGGARQASGCIKAGQHDIRLL